MATAQLARGRTLVVIGLPARRAGRPRGRARDARGGERRRYDEARGHRRSAFTGRYTVTSNHRSARTAEQPERVRGPGALLRVVDDQLPTRSGPYVEGLHTQSGLVGLGMRQDLRGVTLARGSAPLIKSFRGVRADLRSQDHRNIEV
ncbi:Atu4866 domain-containing protein [Streptomyces anulatus]